MKNQTLNDLWKLSKAENKPLLFEPTITTAFPYLQEYIDNYVDFDRQIVRTMGYLEPIYNADDEDTAEAILEAFRGDCRATVRRYDYNLKKLFELIAIEYNPLHNYDRHEIVNDTTHDAGLVINTVDKIETTENLGEATVTKEYGAQHKTDTQGVAGFNDTAFADSTKLQSDAESFEDSTTQGAIENKTSTAARENSIDHSKDGTMQHIADIKGNIGVMSSQQMYSQEWEIIKDKNPYDVLLYFIHRDLLIFHDEGYDPLLTPMQNELFR